MFPKPHQHTASATDTLGQMFISNQYEHKEITAKYYHLSSIISMAQVNIQPLCRSTCFEE